MVVKTLNRSATANRCHELAALIAGHIGTRGSGSYKTDISQLEIQQCSTPGSLRRVWQPVLGIVAQGQKEVFLEEKLYRYGAAQYLVVSVDLPLNGFVVEATTDRPYLGFMLSLDPAQLCDMMTKIRSDLNKIYVHETDEIEDSIPGLSISNADTPLIDCAVRLVKLLDTPQDIPILAPMIIREIHYRLLTGQQSSAVHQIATPGSHMQRIAEVIKLMKADFINPMRVENLAKQASMSLSSFYQHFKAVTSMSPLQYQKQLRLLEARRLMLVENADAANAAYQVGYSSPSQFSREYSRLFGAPPIKDIESLRIA